MGFCILTGNLRPPILTCQAQIGMDSVLHFCFIARGVRTSSSLFLGEPVTMKEPREDRRISSRINQSQTIRVRPADPNLPEEVRTTLNVSWDGIYFATSLGHYVPGMVVHVTRDFHWNDPETKEEQGTIMRVDALKPGRWGIAVHVPRDVWRPSV